MSNLALANDMINRCNAKFCDGTGNTQMSLGDLSVASRAEQLNAIRERMAEEVPVETGPGYTLAHRAFATGRFLDEDDGARVANCGERSYWIYYHLKQSGFQTVAVLSGNSTESIAHDFLVLGTDQVDDDYYSQNRVPEWYDDDIVICDPWFQARTIRYTCGIAYQLAAWTTWMPKVIAATLQRKPQEKTLDRNNFWLWRTG